MFTSFLLIWLLGILAVFLTLSMFKRTRLLLSLLFKHERSIPSFIREFNGRSFSDELVYELPITDEIILTKDGALLGGFSYRGNDIDTLTNELRNATASKTNSIFNIHTTGDCVHIDAVRIDSRNYPRDTFTDDVPRVPRIIDDERRKKYKSGDHKETLYFIYVRRNLPDTKALKILEWLEDRQDLTKDTKRIAEMQIARFEDLMRVYSSSLSSTFNLKRLGRYSANSTDPDYYDNELVQAINISIRQEIHPLSIPNDLSPHLDYILGGLDLVKGMPPKLGDKYLGVVAIDGFPASSTPNMLNKLDEIGICYKWSTRFIFFDSYDAEQQIKHERKFWDQKKRPLLDMLFNKVPKANKIDLDAEAMSNDTQKAQREASSNLVKYGVYNSNFVVFDSDPAVLAEKLNTIAGVVRNAKFNPRIETYNAIEAYYSTLAGDVAHNLRSPMLNTLNLAHLAPTASTWAGEEQHPSKLYQEFVIENPPPAVVCETPTGTPFRLSLATGTIQNTAIFGTTTGGKSTLMGFYALQQLRYPKSRVIYFDKDYTALAPTLAANGNHYRINPTDKKPISFQPLRLIHEDLEFEWAADWIERTIIYQSDKYADKIDHTWKSAIRDALTELQTEELDNRTMSEFISLCQHEEIKQILQIFSKNSDSSAIGRILDGDSDNIQISRFTTFEMAELLQIGENIRYPILEFMFRFVNRTMSEGEPLLLVFDEASFFVRNPLFSRFLKDTIVTISKKNGGVILIFQSISQSSQTDTQGVEDSGFMSMMADNIPNRIYLPNAAALEPSAKKYYKDLGLNEREIELISQMTPKRDYLITKPHGKRLFQLGLSKYALNYCGVPIQRMPEIIELYGEHGIDWTTHWDKKNKFYDILNTYE